MLRLETNQSLSEAINLYRSAGYSEVEAFNDEPHAHHWFEKILETKAPLPIHTSYDSGTNNRISDAPAAPRPR